MAGELGDLGSRLREERERARISQRELARRLGVSASLISQIESGQSKPSVSTLYAIVTELGVSPTTSSGFTTTSCRSPPLWEPSPTVRSSRGRWSTRPSATWSSRLSVIWGD